MPEFSWPTRGPWTSARATPSRWLELATQSLLTGAGDLAISGGGTAIETGASLQVANVSLSGAAAALTMATSLTYAGRFSQTSGALLVDAGDTLTLDGVADSFTGSLGGAGRIVLARGADTLHSATINGGGLVISGASVTLAGAEVIGSTVSLNDGEITIAATNASIGGGGTLILSNSAANRIEGATTSATLNLLDGKIRGAGDIGGGQMALWIGAAGIIQGNGGVALILDTGTNSIVNHGLIEATGAGGVTIASAVANGGELAALGGDLTVDGPVSGAGAVRINGATADFESTFTQNVTFGATGVLELAQAQAFHGTITGFSHSGTNSLDLRDIAFGGSTHASFSGTSVAGVLTITDGAHTASIRLVGNYLKSTFTLASDGQGGTSVVDPTAMPARSQVLVSAMAGYAPKAAATTFVPSVEPGRQPLIAPPQTATA